MSFKPLILSRIFPFIIYIFFIVVFYAYSCILFCRFFYLIIITLFYFSFSFLLFSTRAQGPLSNLGPKAYFQFFCRPRRRPKQLVTSRPTRPARVPHPPAFLSSRRPHLRATCLCIAPMHRDRKSTRLNSSHRP